MGHARLVSALGSCALLACSADSHVYAPAPPGVSSALLLVSGPDGPLLSAVAGVPSETNFPVEREGDEISVLYYMNSLEALQIDPGTVSLFGPEQPSRLLPPFASAARGVLAEDASWRALEALEPPLSELRIAPFDALRCVRAHGCFDPLRAPQACLLDCPTPPAPMSPLPPEPPEPTADPVLLPCAPDWTIVPAESADRIARCEPPVQPVSVACADQDQAQHYGAAACTRIGSDCPSGEYADNLPTGLPILHVRPGAAGGDGSAALPYGSIPAAIAAAGGPALLALAKGTYLGEVYLPPGFALHGACARETILSEASEVPGHWIVRGTNGTGNAVRNLTVRGGHGGLVADSGGTLLVEDVIVEDTAWVGMLADASTLRANRILLRATGRDGRSSAGAQSGGRIELDQVVIEDPVGQGVFVNTAGSSGVLSSIVVRRGTGALSDDAAGIKVANGAQLTLDGALIEDHPYGGLSSVSGATLSAQNTFVRWTHPPPDLSSGMRVANRGLLDVKHGAVDAASWCALALGDRAALWAEDVLIRNSAKGVCSFTGASLRVDRLYQQGTSALGFQLDGDASVRDVWIDGGQGTGWDGTAGHLSGQRMRFQGMRVAMTLGGPSELEDLTVLQVDTGLYQAQGSLRLTRARFEGLPGSAVYLTLVRSATISDVFVSGGNAINLSADFLAVHRIEAHEAGAAVDMKASRAQVSDLAAHNCSSVFLSQDPPGGMRLELSRVLGTGIRQTAVSLAGEGRWSLSDLDLESQDYGVALSGQDLDEGRIGTSRIERARLHDVGIDALSVTRGAQLEVLDLEVKDSSRGIHSRDSLNSPTRTSVTRFLLLNESDVGVWTEDQAGSHTARILLSDGELRGHATALRGAQEDLFEQLTRVLFQDNLIDIE